jgi:hypothetical protein
MNQPKTGSSNEYDQTTPRLFRLRDLHPPKTVASPKVQADVSDQASTMEPSIAPSAVQENPKVFSQASAIAFQTAPQQEPATQTSPSYANAAMGVIEEESPDQLRTRARIERHLDSSPEGRSWMESALAHRKMLVLLLIAIGAAFWTSRADQQSTDPDSAIVDGRGTLEFDPTQFDAGQIVDETADWGPIPTPIEPGSQEMVASTQGHGLISSASGTSAIGDRTAPRNNPHVAAGVDPTTAGSITAAPGSDLNHSSQLASNALIPGKAVNPVVPAQPTNADSQSTHLQSTPTPVESAATGTVANATTQPRTDTSTSRSISADSQAAENSLAFQTVSSKTPRDPSFNAPSLEDLERAAEAAANKVPNQVATELILHDSTTPNAVGDWLKYLPSQP